MVVVVVVVVVVVGAMSASSHPRPPGPPNSTQLVGREELGGRPHAWDTEDCSLEYLGGVLAGGNLRRNTEGDEDRVEKRQERVNYNSNGEEKGW